MAHAALGGAARGAGAIDALAAALADAIRRDLTKALIAQPEGSGATRERLVAIAARPSRKAKRAKRASADVDATAAALLTYVAANEGQSIEQIGKGMGVATKELKLPVIKLLEAKKLKTKGQKRGTKYFAK